LPTNNELESKGMSTKVAAAVPPDVREPCEDFAADDCDGPSDYFVLTKMPPPRRDLNW